MAVTVVAALRRGQLATAGSDVAIVGIEYGVTTASGELAARPMLIATAVHPATAMTAAQDDRILATAM